MLNVKHLFRPRMTAAACYAAIVAGARQPRFYADFGVPDTMDGRLDMLVLHLFMVLRRLKQSGRSHFAQELTEAFFKDVEDNFREIGVSDQAVAKKMRAVEGIYHGRLNAYDHALAQSDDAFASALARNILASERTEIADMLAGYCRDAMATLAGVSVEDIEAGKVNFA
jgi:cytochrome b pre-mRNA-processing protein 3